MWKASLTEITKRAGKKSTLPQIQKAAKSVATDNRLSQQSVLKGSGQRFTRASEALYASQDDFQSHLKSSVLHSSMTSGDPLLRTADETGVLLQRVEQLPFLYAQEAFCALMKAGEIQLALQLVSFWQQKRPVNLTSARRKARKELHEMIRTLEQLKDTTTLNALINITSASLKEQLFAEKERLHAAAATPLSGCSHHLQNKLFSLLGVTGTSDILVHAVDVASHLGREDGMSAFDKVLLVEQCASCTRSTIIPTGTPRVPFLLYRRLQALQTEEKNMDSVIQQACPELSAKLVHPSHYRIIDILSMSIAEARYINENWKEKDLLKASPADLATPATAWQRLMRRVLPQSPALHSVEQNQLLIALITRRGRHFKVPNVQTWNSLRASVVKLLKSPQQSVRRCAASALLRNRHLIKSLRISPAEIMSVYAQTFYSKEYVNASLCSACGFSIRRLCRKGRYPEAARLAWNHLSVRSPASKKYFHAHPDAVDFCVLSMSRAMNDAAAKGTGQRWMGYRSLALLRLAANSSDSVTVLHCVPVCVNAMECGVPFAAVNDALSDIFKVNPSLKKWAITLVRLCSPTETVSLRLHPARRGITSEFRKRLASVCRGEEQAEKGPLVRSPSRSKQLALWDTINGSNVNPRLNSLMWAMFLNESVRGDILTCRFLTKSPATRESRDSLKSNSPTADDVWSWEVAVSIASNCTSPESYQSFLNCLRQRQSKLAARSATDLDSISAVMFSELDMHDSVLSTKKATEE